MFWQISTKKVWFYCFCMALLSIYCSFAVGATYGNSNSAEIYVSPSGSDSNAGTLVSPLKTLNAARDMARKKYLVRSENKLPRVLIIGDSISIGYTPHLRRLLKGVSVVYHNQGNGGPTSRGLANLDKWLSVGDKNKGSAKGDGRGKWDVIHFNFGLHDLKYLDNKGKRVKPPAGHKQVPIKQYVRNLERLVIRLKKTGARLIFATTTPVPDGAAYRIQGDSVIYNRAALKVMGKHRIPVDDLYSAAKSRLSKIQRPHNVHYTRQGYAFLAKQVAEVIKKQLPSQPDTIRQANADKSMVTIYLRAGIYHLTQTFRLNAGDAGTADAPVVYRAYKKECVLITGGDRFDTKSLGRVSDPAVRKRLPAAVRDKVLEINLGKYPNYKPAWPTHFRGYVNWPEIYIADMPLHLSRWPNKGYAKIVKVLDKGDVPRHGDKGSSGGSFVYKEDFLSTLNTNNEIYLGGYWHVKWSDEIIKVASIDKTKKQITLAAPHTYGLGGASGGLYYAVNIPEALDMPGEYVYDYKRGCIYFLPPDIRMPSESKLGRRGDKNAMTGIIALGQYPLIEIKNTSDICFQRLELAYNCGSAFVVKNSHRITLQDSIIRGISHVAVSINGGNNCGINRCHLYNLGATGVSLNGGNRNDLTPAGHYVKHSRINNFSRLQKTYAPAVNLSGVGQYAGYNYIHDAPHNAILFRGNDHIIENNRIEKVCLDTADAGAIYCGRDWTLGGNIIRHNYIAHIGPASHNTNWGIYLDDVASGIVATDNIVIDSPGGMLIGGGRNNTITNNLILQCKVYSIHYDSRGRKIPSRKAEPNSKDTMWIRLKYSPYKSAIWRKRFPWLLKIDNDPQPGMPRFNFVTGNRISNSHELDISSYVSRFGTVGDNVILQKDASIDLSGRSVIISSHYPGLKQRYSFSVGP